MIVWERLDETSWQGDSLPYDFHVRFEDGRFVVDVFNSNIDDDDSAHIASFEADSLDSAMKQCEEFGNV